MAASNVTHVVLTPPVPLVGAEDGGAVEEGTLDTPLNPKDADDVRDDELPVPTVGPGIELLVCRDEAGDEIPLPVGVVRAPVEQGVVGLAVTQAQRELAAPRTAPSDAPQPAITQF